METLISEVNETKAYEFRGMTIPVHMVEALERYIYKRIKPGDFLTAVLSNDLFTACGRADSDNARILPAYAAYLYNEAPSACWGSVEKVKIWLNPENKE